MIPSTFEKSKIPHQPGVYIFKNSTDDVLYVGKAIDLYHRVSSYFSGAQIPKTAMLVEQIADVDTVIVQSELEALILEANLIKKYLPPFNIRLTDDKSYLYIGLTKEDFPKIVTLRKKELNEVKKYWGPFPSSRTVKNTLKSLRRVFPWCSGPGYRSRMCFYYHIGLCPGACAGIISKKDYNKILSRFSKFMDGKVSELTDVLTSEMMQASNQQKFEEAAKIKRILEGISYMTQTNRAQLYLENPNFLEDERQLALESLQKDLNLKKIPERIEAYDISNIQGKESTGSMVVLTNGEIDKSQYRKFKIRITGKPNDVGMHKEMMRRRLNHKEWPLPDLIIIDGGRGQVRGVESILLTANFHLPIYGLAKRMEWLYPPEGEVVKLSRRSSSLKMLQKLRDEAHRFAISYHKKLHRRAVLGF
ncbi:excinuclease ABC subunit UvrC [Patescibacteria group bacterium]|nr:excinuclease ABC subunit UvrC [Patescibacteria group bacterium]